MNKCYSELIKIPTFKERFEYLKCYGQVGAETFGRDRYLNQMFYASDEWKRMRLKIITRDNGCDLGVDGYELNKKNIVIHHIIPITAEDIVNRNPMLLDPENLISVWYETHKALHYGDERILRLLFTERKPGDTCPWK
jgi:hypothetical protein